MDPKAWYNYYKEKNERKWTVTYVETLRLKYVNRDAPGMLRDHYATLGLSRTQGRRPFKKALVDQDGGEWPQVGYC